MIEYTLVLRYMAPEVVFGTPLEEQLVCKSDIYSTALIMWEIATGHELLILVDRRLEHCLAQFLVLVPSDGSLWHWL